MEVDLREAGALIVRAHKGVPFYEAKWRDATRKQRKRRLGRAWLEPDPDGGWRKRRGRVRNGFLDEKRAYREMSRVIAEVEAEQQITPRMREARFEDAVDIWFEHLEFEKRAKPSTLSGYRSLLARPGHSGKKRRARIMREFGGRKLAAITDAGHPALLGEDRPRADQRPHREHPSPSPPFDLRARSTERHFRTPRQPGSRNDQAARRRH